MYKLISLSIGSISLILGKLKIMGGINYFKTHEEISFNDKTILITGGTLSNRKTEKKQNKKLSRLYNYIFYKYLLLKSFMQELKTLNKLFIGIDIVLRRNYLQASLEDEILLIYLILFD